MRTRALTCFLLLSLLVSASAHAEKVKLATGEWTPYTSADMEGYGEFTKRVTIILNEMGLEYGYRFYPWRRCYDAVLNGRVWAAFPYSYTKEREKEVWYTDALSYSTTTFFYYRQPGQERPFVYNQTEDLKNYKLGGITGYFYEEAFREAGLEVDYASKEISAVEKLKLGRIDLLPLNDAVGWHLIHENFPEEADRFGVLPKPWSRNSLHLIVTRRQPESKQRLIHFNEALQKAKGKGLIAP